MKGKRMLVLAAAALGTSGLLAVSGIAGTQGPGGDPAPASFRLADGSAGCAYRDGRLACRTLDGPAALVLEPGGGSRAERGLDVGWDGGTRVVLAGESWWHAGYACRVGSDAIRCTSRSGDVIAVGRDGVSAVS